MPDKPQEAYKTALGSAMIPLRMTRNHACA